MAAGSEWQGGTEDEQEVQEPVTAGMFLDRGEEDSDDEDFSQPLFRNKGERKGGGRLLGRTTKQMEAAETEAAPAAAARKWIRKEPEAVEAEAPVAIEPLKKSVFSAKFGGKAEGKFGKAGEEGGGKFGGMFESLKDLDNEKLQTDQKPRRKLLPNRSIVLQAKDVSSGSSGEAGDKSSLDVKVMRGLKCGLNDLNPFAAPKQKGAIHCMQL